MLFRSVLRSDSSVPLTKADPWDVYNDFVVKCGKPVQMWPHSDGCLVVETADRDQHDKILALDCINSTKVTHSSHPTFNTCKGVIRSGELLNYDTEKLLRRLEPQKVVNVHRIYRSRDGTKSPTSTIILTFRLLKPPTKIQAGYLNIPVTPALQNSFNHWMSRQDDIMCTIHWYSVIEQCSTRHHIFNGSSHSHHMKRILRVYMQYMVL